MKNKLFPLLLIITFTTNAMQNTYCIRPPTSKIRCCFAKYQDCFSQLAKILNNLEHDKEIYNNDALAFSAISKEIETTLKQPKLPENASGISKKIYTTYVQAQSVLTLLMNNHNGSTKTQLNALSQTIEQEKVIIESCVRFQESCKSRISNLYSDLDY